MSYSALAGLWVVEDECLVGLFCSWEKAYDRLLLFMPLCLCCLSPFGAVYAVYAISSPNTRSPPKTPPVGKLRRGTTAGASVYRAPALP